MSRRPTASLYLWLERVCSSIDRGIISLEDYRKAIRQLRRFERAAEKARAASGFPGDDIYLDHTHKVMTGHLQTISGFSEKVSLDLWNIITSSAGAGKAKDNENRRRGAL